MKSWNVFAVSAILMVASTAAAQEIPILDGTLEFTGDDEGTLNAAACDAADAPLSITFNNPSIGGAEPTPGYLANRRLAAWWVGSGRCESVPESTAENYIGGLELGILDTTLYGTQLVFPEDIVVDGVDDDDGSDSAPIFSTHTLLDHVSACDSEVGLTSFRLCLAVDYPADQLTAPQDNNVDPLEPWAHITYTVDTQPPPKPSITGIEGRDGSIVVQVSVASAASGDTDDISDWAVLYRPQPDPPEANPDCSTWGSDAPRTANTADPSDGPISVSFSAANYQPYEFCAYLVDEFDNVSERSEVSIGSAVPSTDFAEGYPNPINPTYGCAAVLPTAPWFLILPLLRRRRRRS